MNGTPSSSSLNPLKDKLARGDLCSVMSVRFARGPAIAQVAAMAGFDALYVDLEHCTMSLDDASHICTACLGTGVTPLVRVPVIDAVHVSRMLDGGAMGIIGPHIRSADDARRLVALCRFAPLGGRSSVAWLPQLGNRALAPAALYSEMNAATLVIAMVEDRASLDNVEAIAAVDGIDAILVGTNDLCADLGLDGQADHPLVDAAFRRVIDACTAHGKAVGVGGLARNEALLARYTGMGARLVSMGTDLACLLDGAKRQAATVQRVGASAGIARP